MFFVLGVARAVSTPEALELAVDAACAVSGPGIVEITGTLELEGITVPPTCLATSLHLRSADPTPAVLRGAPGAVRLLTSSTVPLRLAGLVLEGTCGSGPTVEGVRAGAPLTLVDVQGVCLELGALATAGLEAERVSFEQTRGVAISTTGTAPVSIRHSRFVDGGDSAVRVHSAPDCDFACPETIAELEDNVFEGSGSDVMDGGALDAVVHSLVFRRNLVCGNHADRGGGVYFEGLEATVQNNGFLGNHSRYYGGGLLLGPPPGWWQDAIAVVEFNAFLGNSTGVVWGPPREILSFAGGGAVTTFGTPLHFEHDIVAGQTFGGGVYAELLANPASWAFRWGLWYDNVDGDFNGDLPQTVLQMPLVASPDLPWTPGDCSWESLLPLPGSPVVDAGDPACRDWRDQDGDGVVDTPIDGPCDLGVYGGPHAVAIADLDGDGAVAGVDCDDLDPTRSRGQLVFTDADGDGVGAGEPREVCEVLPGHALIGGDCDDTDPALSPALPERCLNRGVDEDCDGEVDELDLQTVDAGARLHIDGGGVPSVTLVCGDPGPVVRDVPAEDVGLACGCRAAPRSSLWSGLARR
ncbi:MAG: putative metal-binding motif-containing protein [Alphaproteobacteria bacterium]|nr:putative metal-binding motif-containing protein [Alphaproteobacteria bacterium]MCB9693824.1 putative metal-binding motif-containing protein [Alphaproteobacteria bacterium]